jgi:hypothetical protein
MSTAGGSSTMTISAGAAMNSTNAQMLTLSSSLAKTTASWVVGAGGGLDTGAIAVSTWYYFYAIRRPDTGVVDLIFSLNSTSPTLPTNYTQYRYIGGMKTDASAFWTAFTQYGRDFFWSTPIVDFNAFGATTAALLTCSIPVGRKIKAFFNVVVANNNNNAAVYISDPSNADLAVNLASSPLVSFSAGNAVATPANGGGQVSCWTNVSGQVRHRELTTNNVAIATLGWTDLADFI